MKFIEPLIQIPSKEHGYKRAAMGAIGAPLEGIARGTASLIGGTLIGAGLSYAIPWIVIGGHIPLPCRVAALRCMWQACWRWEL